MTRILTTLILVLAAGTSTAQPTISLTQPGGPGDVLYTVTNASPNAELYNLANFTQHSPTGGGPIFGLGLAGSQDLLVQILSPLGSDPFHVMADGVGTYGWQITSPMPSGTQVNVDVVCIEWGPMGYVTHSAVIAATLSL